MLWTDPFASLLPQLQTAAYVPRGDLAVSESDLVLTLDLPGLAPEDLSIEVQGTELTVRGERSRPEVGEGATYVYAQRPFGGFVHRVQIPHGVQADAITASMQNGVLSLIVPKPEPLKPKKIQIGSGAAAEDRQLEEAAV